MSQEIVYILAPRSDEPPSIVEVADEEEFFYATYDYAEQSLKMGRAMSDTGEYDDHAIFPVVCEVKPEAWALPGAIVPAAIIALNQEEKP